MRELYYIILTILTLFAYNVQGQTVWPHEENETTDSLGLSCADSDSDGITRVVMLDTIFVYPRPTLTTPATLPTTNTPEILPNPHRLSTLPTDTVQPYYVSIHSNMLFDMIALPNVGTEFYLGKDFSAGVNWMYAWWSRDKRHRYWRAYGGEIYGRWWFGGAAGRKPLTGHHVGLYGQAFIYDFEWGGEGQMGGTPGGTIFDKTQYGVGIEYGYSLPVGRRINIDFSFGLGYIGGTYVKYKPIDNHYVYQSTHRRNFFGPTKIEVTFVWLIGRGNINVPKEGGDR